MKTITIKVNDGATEEEVVSLLKKHAPEMLEDEFSMLGYLNFIESCYYSYIGEGTADGEERKVIKRIEALLKIWEWKEKNDGAFGWGEVMKANTTKYYILYHCDSKEFHIDYWRSYVGPTELPCFSTASLAELARKELEAEYKVVFNVK